MEEEDDLVGVESLIEGRVTEGGVKERLHSLKDPIVQIRSI